jgi:hypothetical protein
MNMPKAVVISALNRVYEESGERNTDGSANVRASLLQSIAQRYGWGPVKEVLANLSEQGYIKLVEDPEKSATLHFGRVTSAIPD